jgi:Flp pilus assembly protein TadB
MTTNTPPSTTKVTTLRARGLISQGKHDDPGGPASGSVDTSVRAMRSAFRSHGVPAVTLGTALWVIALVVAVVIDGVTDNPWFWTCVVAVISGVLGIAWLIRRDRRVNAQASSGSSGSDDSGSASPNS